MLISDHGTLTKTPTWLGHSWNLRSQDSDFRGAVVHPQFSNPPYNRANRKRSLHRCMSVLEVHQETLPTAACEELTVSIMAKANWLQSNNWLFSNLLNKSHERWWKCLDVGKWNTVLFLFPMGMASHDPLWPYMFHTKSREKWHPGTMCDEPWNNT